VAVGMALLASLGAQERDVNALIRQEAARGSQIMRTLHFLADLYGPRVTGSPNLKSAGKWAVGQMESWGFVNGHLEDWDFGHPGWVNETLSFQIVSPVKDSLVAEAVAWTPGTNGTLTARAFQLTWPGDVSPNDLSAYLESVKEEVRGKIVLAGSRIVVPVRLTATAARRDDEQLRQRYDPESPTTAPGQVGGRGGPRGPVPAMTFAQISRQVDQFLVANGALGRINDAGREHGQIVALYNRTYDITQVVPTVVVRNEDYGRISRIIGDGTPVELMLTIVNRMYPEGRTAYNAISEIAGTDRKDEVVMLGAHLDSWHAATGATDNAVGCAIVMEAARILKAIGVTPRRTIRVALWGGEELGLLGSQAYVRTHFGSFESPKPAFATLSAYLNVDTGTGRVRGVRVFGPSSAAAVLRETLAPFKDLGVVGAAPSQGRSLGGTDVTVFYRAGLPGIFFDQDPIQYDSHTHHTNLDTYERIVEADAQQASIIVAATAYRLAMRDDMLPRFSAPEMPTPGR
jgi:hypothetical protein